MSTPAYTYNHQARRSASYFSLYDIENAHHHYLLRYIDDDGAKHQKEIIIELPAFMDLLAVPVKVSEKHPYVLDGVTFTTIENLSLKNGLPIPF